MITPDNLSIIVPCYKWTTLLAETLLSLQAACTEAGITRVYLIVNAGAFGKEYADEIRGRVNDRNLFEVSFWDTEERLPIFQNWNRCVASAQLRYVHLMHDDDRVSRYYYCEMMRLSREHPGAGLYTCGVLVFGDESYASIPQASTGVLEHASLLLARQNVFKCPEFIIERNGFPGFDERLSYVADWNAWFRVSLKRSVVVTNEMLFFYRTHRGSTTSKLAETNQKLDELANVEAEHCKEYSSFSSRPLHPEYTLLMTSVRLEIQQAVDRGQYALALRKIRTVYKYRFSAVLPLLFLRKVCARMLRRH